MSKLWLTLVCGDNSYTDLVELYEPIKQYFNGCCAVCHAAPDSMEAKYLETVKGEGRIIYMPYLGRHDLTRNIAVHCGVIEDGDTVCQFDCLERLNPQFAASIPELMSNMDQVDAFYYYGKILLYRYHESVTFIGSPHEGWLLQHKRSNAIELNKAYPNEADVRLNVRPQKRPPDHWVSHFARYMLLPWGSNHCLLGLEANGDPATLFPIRERKRLAFRAEMKRRGYPLTIEGLRQMFSGPIDVTLRDMIQSDKVWSDWYWYYIKGRRDVVCGHDDKDMIRDEIPLDTPQQVK